MDGTSSFLTIPFSPVLWATNAARHTPTSTYVCRGCREERRPPVVQDVDVQIRTGPDHEFRIRAIGPVARCGCGMLTIRDQESDSFMDALIHALKQANIARY